MDKGHELAFINQNFNNVASVIGQNSFVIVQSGTITSPIASVTPAANQYQSDIEQTIVAHNLGYKPVVLAYMLFNSANYIPIPYTYVFSALSSVSQCYWWTTRVETDSTNIVVLTDLTAYNASQSAGGVSVKYYLLQQTAN